MDECAISAADCPILHDPVWEDRIDQAAQRGAALALKSIGLSDAGAARDMIEMRSLITAWRDMKREARRTVTRWVTMILLGLLLLAVGAKVGLPVFWWDTRP